MVNKISFLLLIHCTVSSSQMVKIQIGGNSNKCDNRSIEIVLPNDTVQTDGEASRVTTMSGLLNHQRVQEVNVCRGREVIAAHSGSAGSLCLVVRRPG